MWENLRSLCTEIFPDCLTGREHTANAGKEQPEQRETADDAPPEARWYQLWYRRIGEGDNDCQHASKGRNDDASPQDRHGKDTPRVKGPPIPYIEHQQIDEQERAGDCPYHAMGIETDREELVRKVERIAK